MKSSNWTKNEQDINAFATLVSHKMYFDESKVPDYIKAFMVEYSHLNFAARCFDNLCWISIQYFLMLAFEHLHIKTLRSEICEDFQVKGGFLYRTWYQYKDIKFYHYDAMTQGFGVSPIHGLSKAILTKDATIGCGHCKFTGDDCSYCANGKLVVEVAKYASQQNLNGIHLHQEGWNVLSEVFGAKRVAALFDLAGFCYKWLTDDDFVTHVLSNRIDWANDAEVGDYIDHTDLDKYFVDDRYGRYEEEEDEE